MTSNSISYPKNVEMALAKAKKMRSLEPIWDLPDVDSVIPALRPHDLYTLIVRTGIQDSLEFLSLATPTQIRSAMDFDCWNKDRVILSRYLDWLSALSMLGFEKLGATISQSDPELVALFLMKSTVIFNLKDGEPPDLGDIPIYRTPDTFFEIYPREGTDEDIWRGVTALLDHLYRYDLELARSTILDAMWSTSLHLEESAYKWMKGRIEDEGFYDYVDALSIYKWIDPSSVTLGSKTREPAEPGSLPAIVPPWSDDTKGPWFDAINTLDTKDRDAVTLGMVSLFNRMAAADRISVDDEEGLNDLGALASGCLNMGCSFIAKNNPEQFGEVAQQISPVRVFQVGYSLIHQLKGLALTLSRSGHISLSPRTSTLLEGPWKRFYDALTKGHPMIDLDLYHMSGARRFATLNDVTSASNIIEDMSMLKAFLFKGLKLSPALLTPEGLSGANKSHPGQVTFGDLFRTFVVAHLSGAKLHNSLLDAASVDAAKEALSAFSQESLDETLLNAISLILTKEGIPVPLRLGTVISSFTAPLFTETDLRHLIVRAK